MTNLTYSPFSCYTSRLQHASARLMRSRPVSCVWMGQSYSPESETAKDIQGRLSHREREEKKSRRNVPRRKVCPFVSLYKSKKSVCVCVPQKSQDQTDLRFSTWLLRLKVEGCATSDLFSLQRYC